jgi:hypothetical protein
MFPNPVVYSSVDSGAQPQRHLFVEPRKEPTLGIPFNRNVNRTNVLDHQERRLAPIENGFG